MAQHEKTPVDPKEVERLKKYRALFAESDGKAILLDLLLRFDVAQPPGSVDDLAFTEGQRLVVRSLCSWAGYGLDLTHSGD